MMKKIIMKKLVEIMDDEEDEGPKEKANTMKIGDSDKYIEMVANRGPDPVVHGKSSEE